MKRIITASVVAALALTSVQAESLSDRLSSLEAELTKVKKKLKKQNKKINAVKAHDSGDNIKWGVDLRTAIDSINYDMAGKTFLDGDTSGPTGPDSYGKNDLMSLRLWLNMAYAPNANNVFKGQLSMNKAFGADVNGKGWTQWDNFDWIGNEALRNDTLHVRQAYWLYLGEEAFGLDMPWTFSLGRRPSTGGFLANLSQDDAAQSPLGHIINVEFDGLSSKLDLSKVTGVPGMSIKVCMGQGATNAVPMLNVADGGLPNYSNDSDAIDDVQLAGFIFEPYNDGQIITKATAFRAFDVPGFAAGTMGWNTDFMTYLPDPSSMNFVNTGDMDGAAFSVLIDGVTEEGYFADVKLFGSFAWSNSKVNNTNTRDFVGGGPMDATGVPISSMFGSMDDESGTSYWFGAYLPVTDGENDYGKLGLEYNHGSQYWKGFTQAEDTMIGSKLATRGDAWEVNYTYQINEALSFQARYVSIDYKYTGSNGFYGDGGYAMDIDTIKALAADGNPTAMGMAQGIVDKAQDTRFYLRYRF